MLTGEVGNRGSKIHGSFTAGYSSNLYDRHAYESQSMVTYSSRLDFRLKGANLVRAFISGYQQEQQGQEHKFSDGFLAWVNNSFWMNDFVYGKGWSYGGVQRDDSWQFASEVGYTFKSGINLAGGFSNAGPIRNLQYGSDQTIDLFNSRTASVYSELSYLF